MEFEHDEMDKTIAKRLGSACETVLRKEIQDTNSGMLYYDSVEKQGYHIKDIQIDVHFLEVIEGE